jgi:hypothetical protein
MFAGDLRQRGRGDELRRLRAGQRGPAQALCERRAARPLIEQGAFCAALLGSLTYRLPADVDVATWRVALRHFAQRRPPQDPVSAPTRAAGTARSGRRA